MQKSTILQFFMMIFGLSFLFVPIAQAWECYVDPIYERNWCGRYKIAAYVLERECSGTPKLETVPAGTVLPIIAETDGWYKIKTNKGNIGWTGSSLMEVVDCSLLTPANSTSVNTNTVNPNFTVPPKGSFNLLEHVKGRMLLAVEDHGKIWYVSPVTGKRYQATVDNALPLFRSLALGITNADLNKLPLYGGVQHRYNMELRNRIKGRLLLAVEDHGRVWYVGKDDTWRREVTKENIMDVFRAHSLGITNLDLAKIPIGDVNESEVANNPAPEKSVTNTTNTNSGVVIYDLPDSGMIAPDTWQNYSGNGFNFYYPSTWLSGSKNIYPNWKYFSEEVDYIANLNTPNYLDVDSYALAYKVATSVSTTVSDAEALKKGGYYLTGYNIIETDVFIINGIPALRELLYAPRGTTVNGNRVTGENEYIILYTYRSGTNLYRLQYFSAHWQDRYNFEIFDLMAKTFKLN